MFSVVKKSKKSAARLTELKTRHGIIRGPFFMPVATKAAVKNISAEELVVLEPQIILSNTYHLMLAPGTPIIKRAGGLHAFMQWSGPILTDSGGFQVFSLSKFRKITEHGVQFADPSSGTRYLLPPEKSMTVQHELGVDIAMAFDDVIGYPAEYAAVEQAMQRTTRWAKRCIAHKKKIKAKYALFGIVQGGTHKQLRLESARELVKLNFDGYAIGGVAVGEPRNKMKNILNWTVAELPETKPRYLMGLGRPEEIVTAVQHGIDMFDCVIPTREARHGRLYIWKNPSPAPRQARGTLSRKGRGTREGTFYKTINITNAKFAKDFSPINQTNLKQYSKAYLHHLFKTQEPLAMRLATLHNLEFYLTLMADIRKNIQKGLL